jgi:hypothetical protein
LCWTGGVDGIWCKGPDMGVGEFMCCFSLFISCDVLVCVRIMHCARLTLSCDINKI